MRRIREAALLGFASFIPLWTQGPGCLPDRPASFTRIDAHVHVAPPPPAFREMLDRLNVRALNVTLVDPLVPGFDKPEPQATWAAGIAGDSNGRIGWVSPLDPTGFESPDWAAREIERLRADFDRSAVAAKIYKSVGLQLKSKDGRYILPDDPVFEPVLAAIAGADRTLIAHLAEPRSSWRPLDPTDPHYGYYKANPEWHSYLHPERPGWDEIIDARDRLLAAYPNLRVVGCHLGSMAHDVDEVALRLDKYPNFAVDTAARIPDLMRQPREKVRDFVLRYQDRILWGTDLMELQWEAPAEVIERWEAAYSRDWRYFATADAIPVGNDTVRGLALPDSVVRKIFRENALRWIPRLASALSAPVQAGRPLPSVDEVLSRYLDAAGGEEALRNVTTRAAEGAIFVATYGAYGEYRELAMAPNMFRRTFRFPGVAILERAFDGEHAWEESPEYGVEPLTGKRFSQVRRQAQFHPALTLRSVYPELSVRGRDRIDEHEAVVLEGLTAGREKDLLWFSDASGLLLAAESTETFANGVEQRVRYLYEDYRPLDGIQVPHQIRYESPRLIWVVTRQVVHNVPVDDSVFLMPNE